MKLPRILVVDDQYARDAAMWTLFVRRAGLKVVGDHLAGSPVGEGVLCPGQVTANGRVENDYGVIRKAVAEDESLALVLLDVQFDSGPLTEGFPQGQQGDAYFGEDVRRRLASDFPNLPVVMLSGKRQEELADKKTPYLSKQGLDERWMREALLRHGRLTPEQARRLLDLGLDTVAQASATLVVICEAFVHAAEAVSILLLGESGTGKEVLARYIHTHSRRSGLFVGVNISALPRELLEAELFGVEKGAATGVGERPGKFELAEGGTLFLDEIGDMPLEAQVKLLRAVQEREIDRVGGRKPIKIDIRLVCATSRDLPAMVAAGSFRKDLYFRINHVPISIPPLRERAEDIVPMGRAFLNRFQSESGKIGITLSAEAAEALKLHPFPGNVRELENLIRRLVSGTGHHRVISAEEVGRALVACAVAPRCEPARPGGTEKTVRAGLAELTGFTGTRLVDVHSLLEGLPVDKDDPALVGARARLDTAYRNLMQRLAGAALERCRDPVTGQINRQRAMQLLTGDTALKGKGPVRVVNEILGRRQETPVEEPDLEALVMRWRNGGD